MAVIAQKCKDLIIEVLDIDEKRIALWNSKDVSKIPVFEPGLEEIIEECRDKNLFFSTDIKGAIETSI